MMYLNQTIVLLYQAYKKSIGKGPGWIIDSIIEEEWQKLRKILQKDLILKTLNLQSEIHTKLKKRVLSTLVFLVMKIKKNIQSMYQKMWKKTCSLLLIQDEGKRHYVHIRDLNTFMYDHILHCGRKHFCWYCLQAFSAEEILKCYIKGCLKIEGKQKIKMSEED